jgi:MFS superfamily sulfate permease-like transporter
MPIPEAAERDGAFYLTSSQLGGYLRVQALIVLLIIFVWPWWKTFKKAGYPGWFGLGMFIPLLNLILLFYFAFAEWLILRGGKQD